MTELNLRSKPIRSENVAHQSMPPDTVLLNLDNGYYYSTNSVGAAVWELCLGEKTVAEIAEEVLLRFHAADRDIAKDIMELLRDMAKEGLVKIEKV